MAYTNMDEDAKAGVDGPFLPVDTFSMGKSPWHSAKTSAKQLIRNPLLYIAGILFFCIFQFSSSIESIAALRGEVSLHFSGHKHKTHIRNVKGAPGVGDVQIPKGLYSAVESDMTDVSDEAMRLFMWQDQECRMMGNKEYDEKTCAGPPYLYLSFHGGNKFKNAGYVKEVHQVCKFSTDGCGMGAVIMPSRDKWWLKSARSLTIDTRTNELYVIDAYRRESEIRVFGACNAKIDNRREPLRTVMQSGADDPALIHPYGLAFSPVNHMLHVTTQGTYGVLRYGPSGKLKKRSTYMSKWLASHCPDHPHDPGCHGVTLPNKKLFEEMSGSEFNSRNMTKAKREALSKFNFPNSFAVLPKGDVRGVAIDKRGNVFVANKKEGIQVFAPDGTPLKQLDVVKEKKNQKTEEEYSRNLVPVSIIYDEMADLIWTGCAKSHTLLAFDAKEMKQAKVMRFAHEVKHPIGLEIIGDHMYLVSQGTSELLRANISEDKMNKDGHHYVEIIIEHLSDTGEFLVKSDC